MNSLPVRSLSFAAAAISILVGIHGEAAAQNTAMTNQTQQVLNYYGGNAAYNTLNEMPRRSPIQPASSGPLQHNGKPFQGASTGPTVSPYLNLFRDERGATDDVPSYYTYVRPQLDQQATFQQQQREIQQLQRQMQNGANYRRPGDTQARYMDTAQFYGGWQR